MYSIVIISTLSKGKNFWISVYVGKALHDTSFLEVVNVKVPSSSYSIFFIFPLTDCAGSRERLLRSGCSNR